MAAANMSLMGAKWTNYWYYYDADGQKQLTTNPPDYIKKILDRLSRATDNKSYIPGPNSWQPGQGIPEGYRQERNERRRFPSGEN